MTVCPSAEAVEEAANDGHNGSCIHWLFVNLSQEVELWKGNVSFIVVELVCTLEVGVFVFGENMFVMSEPGGESGGRFSHFLFGVFFR